MEITTTAEATLGVVEAAVLSRRTAEVALLRAAADWADLHGDHEGVTRGHGSTDDPGQQRVHPAWRRWGGEGTPVVAQFAPAELAVSLRVHPAAARAWIADALDLRHRLAPLWQAALAGAQVEVWVLRRIAVLTRDLTGEAAALIAHDIAPVIETLPTPRLLERVEALVLLAQQTAAEDADHGPDGDGQTQGQGRGHRFVTFNRPDRRGLKGLYAKLAAEEAVLGEAQVQRLAEVLLARDKAAGVPVAELDSMQVARSRALGLLLADPQAALALISGDQEPAQGSQGRVTAMVHLHLSEHALQALATASISNGPAPVPGVGRLEGHGPITLPEALALLRLTNVTIRPVLDTWTTRPVDSYAFTGSLREAVLTRTPADCYPHAVNTTHRMDLDHTMPYDPQGPPGQTSIDNAGPLTRHHHRIKTTGLMSLRQPVPDTYVWRTPHHRYRLVDSTGTHDVPAWLGALVFSDRPDDIQHAALLLTTGLTHGITHQDLDDWTLTA